MVEIANNKKILVTMGRKILIWYKMIVFASYNYYCFTLVASDCLAFLIAPIIDGFSEFWAKTESDNARRHRRNITLFILYEVYLSAFLILIA